MTLSRFDRIVWAVLALLALAILTVRLAGDRVGLRVEALSLSPDGLVAARAPLVLRFDQPMRAVSVTDSLYLEPTADFSLAWQGQDLIILPQQAWQAGQEYRLRLAVGLESQQGHSLLEDFEVRFQARAAGIAYLLEVEGGRQLWALPDLEGQAVQLSASGQNVFDFAVAPNGERLAYSVLNDAGGLDLWLVDRLGEQRVLFLDCGADRCSAPAWSPDGRQIAYNRAPAGLAPGEPYGPQRIWLLDVSTGETLRLHADTQKLGYAASWSPNGERLAYFDGLEGRIVVVDMDSGNETYLPSQAGSVGSWSPNGEQMLYAEIQSSEQQALSVIYRADFAVEDILPLFDPAPSDADYRAPVWSPSGERVAFRVQAAEAGPGDQIWVTPPDGAFALVVTDEENYLHAELNWDPWGSKLLFKRIALGVPFPDQEVWIWSQSENQLSQVLPDAVAPAWLP